MRFAYIILAHEHPELVARTARLLMADGGLVTIHFDRSAPDASFRRLKAALGDDAAKVLWPDRVRVSWGEWSIIEATLNALQAIETSGKSVDYVHLMSGADYPIRPLAEFRQYVETNGGDFIECYDMRSERWITDGLVHERYRYRHLFNYRRHPKLFEKCWKLQRTLGLKRTFPAGIKPYVGSQWWTLRWSTCATVLAAGRNKAWRRFFRRVWIPDEMFIQSVVGCKVPVEQRRRFCLTLFQFTDYGKPVVYANDHAAYLMRQNFFFARKLSPHAARLRDELDKVVRGEMAVEPLVPSGVGKRTAEYETARLAGRTPQPGRRSMGHEKDPWRGDLAWNNRLMIAVFGACEEELRLVQQILSAAGTIESHGALFDPDRIEFAGQRKSVAGYGRSDVKLRDSRRTTFLTDVVTSAAPRTVSYLLPWKKDDEIRDVALWSPETCALIVRGNVFRAFVEQQVVANGAMIRHRSTAGSMSWVPPGEFDKFCKEYEDYHQHLWETAQKAGLVCQELSLIQAGWLTKLMHFLECSVPPAAVEGRPEPMRPITSEWIERISAQLSDPAQSIANIRGLAELRLPERHRTDHTAILASGARVASPEAEPLGGRLRGVGRSGRLRHGADSPAGTTLRGAEQP